jgi:hypothetical protein
MLVAFISAQMCQSLHLMRIDNMIKTDSCYTFTIYGFKQSRPTNRYLNVSLPAYSDHIVCVFHVLEEYLVRTAPLRGDNQELFLGLCKRHKPVTSKTISRWIKRFMLTDHGLHVGDILRTAGWSNAGTFAKFYHRDVDLMIRRFLDRMIATKCTTNSVYTCIEEAYIA